MNRIHGALISARYSTDNQKQDSIEVQVEKCTEWCTRNKIPVLGVFADEAVSGMKDTRPRYEAMMAQLKSGIGDTVVIYDQSRMFRKMTAWFAFRDQLAALGVDVVSVTQPNIGKDLRDPTNFLTEGSMALFNQIWALQSRQKTIEKMRYMARNGQHTGGKPALGYTAKNGRLEICEEEAATVRRIFAEYAAGRSYREIIEGLNRDGLKTKRGNAFGANSLHDLLHNEVYTGTIVYGKSPMRQDGTRNRHATNVEGIIRVEGAVPAIVERELFERVQKRMQENKRKQGGRPPIKRDYPLKGKVFCAECKSAMTVTTSQGKYYYYKCNQKKRQHNCAAANISVDELERIVVEALRKILGKPQKIEHLIKILRDQRSAVQDQAVDTLQRLVNEEWEIDRKLANAADAVLNGLSSPTVLARIEELERRKAEISARMRELRATVDASEIPAKRLEEIIESIAAGTAPGADAALLSIVNRVEVGADTVTIWTILDTNPDGTYDYDENGVLLTEGTASGVPKQNNPNLFSVGEGFGLFLFLGGQYG